MRIIYLLAAAGTALTNSTDETVLDSYTIPAHTLQANTEIHFRALVRSTDNNSTDTLTVRVRLGPTTLTGTVVFLSAAIDQVDDDIAVVHGVITVRSIGSAGEVAVSTLGAGPDASATATGGAGGVVISSLDTTAALLLEVTGEWSVAHADNSCQCEQLTVYEVAR